MSRPRGDDPFGLRRVHARRAEPLSRPASPSARPGADSRAAAPVAARGSSESASEADPRGQAVGVRGLGGRKRASSHSGPRDAIGARAGHTTGSRSRTGADRGDDSASRPGAQEGDPGRQSSSRSRDASAGSEPRGLVDAICDACPLGLVASAWRDAEPEAIDHLLAATHEMLGAVRAVIDAADEVVSEQRTRRARASKGVRRIDVE